MQLLMIIILALIFVLAIFLRNQIIFFTALDTTKTNAVSLNLFDIRMILEILGIYFFFLTLLMTVLFINLKKYDLFWNKFFLHSLQLIFIACLSIILLSHRKLFLWLSKISKNFQFNIIKLFVDAKIFEYKSINKHKNLNTLGKITGLRQYCTKSNEKKENDDFPFVLPDFLLDEETPKKMHVKHCMQDYINFTNYRTKVFSILSPTEVAEVLSYSSSVSRQKIAHNTNNAKKILDYISSRHFIIYDSHENLNNLAIFAYFSQLFTLNFNQKVSVKFLINLFELYLFFKTDFRQFSDETLIKGLREFVGDFLCYQILAKDKFVYLRYFVRGILDLKKNRWQPSCAQQLKYIHYYNVDCSVILWAITENVKFNCALHQLRRLPKPWSHCKKGASSRYLFNAEFLTKIKLLFALTIFNSQLLKTFTWIMAAAVPNFIKTMPTYRIANTFTFKGITKFFTSLEHPGYLHGLPQLPCIREASRFLAFDEFNLNLGELYMMYNQLQEKTDQKLPKNAPPPPPCYPDTNSFNFMRQAEICMPFLKAISVNRTFINRVTYYNLKYELPEIVKFLRNMTDGTTLYVALCEQDLKVFPLLTTKNLNIISIKQQFIFSLAKDVFDSGNLMRYLMKVKY